MIDVDQFSLLFDKLCAAFGTTKPDKTKTAWFEEFDECDYFTFCRAIKILQRGDRFPNWGMIWDTYRPILPANLRFEERTGCKDCVNGVVFYVDYILPRPEDPNYRVISYSLIANCGMCSEDEIKSMGTVYRKEMVLQRDGDYWTKKALDALPAELKKVTKENKERREKWETERGSRYRTYFAGMNE